MRSFAMVVRHELGDGVSKVALPERHDAMQTFLFDGATVGFGDSEAASADKYIAPVRDSRPSHRRLTPTAFAAWA